MSPLETVSVGLGWVMAFAFLLQAWRVFWTRSAEDVSLWTYGILGVVMTLWLLYGVAKGNWTIFWEYLFSAFGAWLTFGLSIAYRRNKDDIANEHL